MTKFMEQMKRLHDDSEEYTNIFFNDDWELEDYKQFTYYIKLGYLIQSDTHTYFVVNPEWEWNEENEDWEDI